MQRHREGMRAHENTRDPHLGPDPGTDRHEPGSRPTTYAMWVCGWTSTTNPIEVGWAWPGLGCPSIFPRAGSSHVCTEAGSRNEQAPRGVDLEPFSPIVLITAHEDEQARRAALGAGAVAFLRTQCDDRIPPGRRSEGFSGGQGVSNTSSASRS
jgi:hypothetical protein